GGAAAHLRRDAQDHPVRYPRDRGGNPARRRGGGDDGASRPHQGGHRRRPAAPALARHGQFAGVRGAVRSHLPPDPRGGHGRDGAAGPDGGRLMSVTVSKRRNGMVRFVERVLPAATVVLFILGWEAFVRVRGIAPIYLPPPSTVAIYLWRML